MQTPPLSLATLEEFYRFALLLSGDADTASHILADTLRDVEAQLAELRHESSRAARLATGIRHRCLQENAHNPKEIPRLLREDVPPDGTAKVLHIEAFILAQRFSTLPEPERSALALFYVDLFNPAEIAKLLKMSEEDLSTVIIRGRQFLSEALHPSA